VGGKIKSLAHVRDSIFDLELELESENSTQADIVCFDLETQRTAMMPAAGTGKARWACPLA
jgi:hypothetical protein